MNAFVGHSFDPKDKSVVDCFISFLTRNGIPCEDGEKPQNKDISDKIKILSLFPFPCLTKP